MRRAVKVQQDGARFGTSSAGRLRWGLVDQASSAASNFSLNIWVAATATPDEFGAFSLVYVAYLTCLGLSRAIGGEVLLIGNAPRRDDDREWLDALAAASALGWAGAAAFAALAVFLGGSTVSVVLPLVIGLPVLILQDTLRYVFISDKRPERAAMIDLVWLALFLVFAVPLSVLERFPVTALLVYCWVGAGIASTLVTSHGRTAMRSGLVNATRASRWVRSGVRTISLTVSEFAATSGAGYALIFALPALAGREEVAALRGAQVLFGPVNVIVSAIPLVGIPYIRQRRLETAKRRAWPMAGIALALLSVSLLALIVSLPDSMGTLLLGLNWPLVEVVLPIYAAERAISIIGFARLAQLRADSRTATGTRARSVGAVVGLSTGLVGAARWGAQGAAVGILLGSCVTVLLMIRSRVREDEA